MPLVVVEGHLVVVSNSHRPVAQVEDQVDVAVDELDGQEVVSWKKEEEEVGVRRRRKKSFKLEVERNDVLDVQDMFGSEEIMKQ